MELKNCIKSRRSVRTYSPEPIYPQTLKAILQAGLMAPTGKNRKPLEFFVVKGKEKLEALSKTRNCNTAQITGCQAAIVVVADSSAETWIEDGSLAMGYMALAAQDFSIGSCWCHIRDRKDAQGHPSEQMVREFLGLDDKYRVLAILTLGYPAHEHKDHELTDEDWQKVHGL